MATILVVDDYPLNRQLLVAILGYLGHQTPEAGDGIEALDIARRVRPDLIITDILMPKMDGYELVMKLRAEPALAETPVIFYTATYREHEARGVANACGVKWVLPKPSEPEQIIAAVQAALGVPLEMATQSAASTATPFEPDRIATIDDEMIACLGKLTKVSNFMEQLALKAQSAGHEDNRLQQVAAELSESTNHLQATSLRLSSLIDVGIEFSSERELEGLSAALCQSARGICVAKFAAVAVLDQDEARLRYFFTSGFEADALAQPAATYPDIGVLDTLMKGQSSCRMRTLDLKPQALGFPESASTMGSFLAVAIHSGERVLGWLYLSEKLGANEFSKTDEQVTMAVAAQFAVAYENLVLYEKTQQYAHELELEIIERKENQKRIARLGRVYAVLSGINSALVRMHDREALFQEACRIAVNEGAFGMAWIGTIDPDTQEGKVVAWSGCEPAYVEKIRLTARADTPHSDRLASIAVREERPVIYNDISAELPQAAIRDELLARGHQSVAAFPLMLGNRAVAVIALFAAETGVFDEGELKLLYELAGDISFGLQYIDKEEKLHYLAYYDALTGLPNSMLFHDRLTQFLHGSKQEQSMIAAILLDLNHFSQFNDALGRHVGDILLKQVAERLSTALQEPYSLARISGDKFGIAIPDLQQDADAAAILEQQIFAAFSQPFLVEQHEIRITARAGVALFPGDGRDAETLFKHAEIALKKAQSASERYLYYAPQMNAAIAARLALEGELQVALDARQFVMYFQPRVDLRSGRIIGAEALIRWQHPERGLVPPVQFIPLAEETGLIVPIGAWAIDAVCAQQSAWPDQQIEIVPVAVNLSALQFKKGQVLQTIRDALATHHLDHKYIEFELTESIVMENPEEAAHDLQQLKEMGLQLSLDDFGTGYSSLAYLKRFPFDFVKIDRAFVTDITHDSEDAAIANAIIGMAHGLNLRVVAEGVETEGQLSYLRQHDCDELQGYYFSPPVPAEVFGAMLREDRRLRLN